MTDRSAPPYRYWGNHKPVAFAPVRAETATGSAAEMRIYGPIDSWGAPFGVSASEFGQALADLGDVESITLHVHSPGGDAFDGVAIMNQLRQHKATVNVVVDGLAASAASIVCMGADSVSMAPGSQLMIHRASVLTIGNAEDLATDVAMLAKLDGNMADQYAAKAGGNSEEWLAAMTPESWYTAEEAVQAGLADRVLPASAKAEQPSAQFDLSIFAHAGREQAPAPKMPAALAATQTPAEPPVIHPNDPKEADAMSDTLNKGLRERLGVTDDGIDEAGLLSALDEALAEAAAPAAASLTEPAAIPEGKVIVSQNVLDELRAMAQAGAEARGKQLAEERDEAIQAAFSAGKISAARRDAWKASWDKDPEGTKADLDTLPARFPVAAMPGTPGHDGDTVKEAPFTDDEGDALAALAGLPKGALR